MAGSKPVTVLLVEDEPAHARLIELNLRRGGVHNDIVKVADGRQALDYLFSKGDFEGIRVPEPLLVLLDLNMPLVSGEQVLRKMRENEATRRIPVVVLTTTDDQREINRCYDLGCNLHITKPVDFDEFSKIVRELGFLVENAAVPSGAPP